MREKEGGIKRRNVREGGRDKSIERGGIKRREEREENREREGEEVRRDG